MKKYNTKFKWDHTHTHNTYIYNKISSERIKIRGTHALGREIALPKNPTTGGWWTFEFVGSYISSIPRTESVFWMLAVTRAVQMPTRVVPGPYTCPLKSTL
jgi:hypothetical protein